MATVDRVIEWLKGRRGVRAVYHLAQEDKAKVLKVEEEAGRKVLAKLGRGDNQGLKSALSRDISLVLITDAEFEWPEGSEVLLIWEGDVFGMEVNDPRELEDFKRRGDVVIMGNFVIFRDKIPPIRQLVANAPLVVFPPKPLPKLEEAGARNAVIGFPSPPTDLLLKKMLKISVEDRLLGTAVVGFNL
ncbi:MAG: hypothetical protein QXJ75_00255 [Candidatus Bathyarchaeia archaeon]